jgi:hypothetical protein
MISCTVCGKRHKDEKGLTLCREKAERAAARADKAEKERLRREKNAEVSPEVFIRERRRLGGAGGTWERIVSSLNKDYPPRPEPWGIWEVVSLYAKQLKWPCSVDQRVQMLLEKHYTGEYLTAHPLNLDGVREALYVGEVYTPEQLRIATGWDVTSLDEGIVDDRDSED